MPSVGPAAIVLDKKSRVDPVGDSAIDTYNSLTSI
jgi:hypothetical protein